MECKKIKMLTAGPNNNRFPGSFVIVDKVRAEILVANGHAEYEAEVKQIEPKVNNPTKPRTSKPRTRPVRSKA